MIRDARQSARRLRYTVAVIALAGTVAACSTTSTPLIVDALTLDNQAAAGVAATPDNAASDNAVQATLDNTARQEGLSASGTTQLAYTNNEESLPAKAQTNSAGQAGTPNSATGAETSAQAAASTGDAAKEDRLDSGTKDTESPKDQALTEKKSGFFASLFAKKPANSIVTSAYAETDDQSVAARESLSAEPAALQIQVPDRGPASAGSGDALPGVRQQNLFEIDHKSSIEDIDTIDAEERDSQIQLAFAPGMARMSPQGFIRQRDDVDISCLRPSLVGVLKKVEQRFGEPVIITSGYRSKEHNRRVHGAKNSMHMYCAAADIKVPGTSKWELAKYLRSMPGRGGVGTYCHTNSVHVDVGPERDWNWRCRRRRS